MAKLTWNESELKKAIAQAAEPAVKEHTERICQSAQAMSSGFRTGLYHRDHKSPAVGNTAPKYEANIENHGGVPVGIVYTGNYSAMKDNHENNTLLKARG